MADRGRSGCRRSGIRRGADPFPDVRQSRQNRGSASRAANHRWRTIAGDGSDAGVSPAGDTREAAINQADPPAGEKQPKPDQAGETRPVPRVTGKCDLTESEIPKTLDRAEHYLHAGQLEEAQVQYERVVGCPAAHEKAQAGLKLVKQRIETQGSSAP